MFQHEFKKIRNSLIKSMDVGHTDHGVRLLKHTKDHILWTHWKDAFNWDQKTNSMKIYHKLAQDHIEPNNEQLMRNSLAIGVLNSEMLHLMKVGNPISSGVKCY